MKDVLCGCAVVEAEQEQEDRRRHEEGHGECGADPPPQYAPLHDISRDGEQRADDGELREQLASQELEKLDAIQPVRGHRMVHPGIARPADEEEDLRQALQRAVEVDRHRHPRAADHPDVGQKPKNGEPA